MGNEAVNPKNAVRQRTLGPGLIAVITGCSCIIAAYLAIPRPGPWLDQTTWGYGYRFDFAVVNGQCVPHRSTDLSIERGDSAVYSVENFGTPIDGAPPLLGWLWKSRIVGLNVKTRQTIIWPEQAGELLPADFSAQMTVIVEAAINSRRDGFGTMEGSRLGLARELCLPVSVTATSGSIHLTRPELSQPAPRMRLTAVTVLTALGTIFILLGAWLAAKSVWVTVRSLRRGRIGHCEGCGYQMEELQVCPECGRTQPQHPSKQIML